MTTRYTREHEWVRLEGDVAVVGISKYAQDQLGDIVEATVFLSSLYAALVDRERNEF